MANRRDIWGSWVVLVILGWVTWLPFNRAPSAWVLLAAAVMTVAVFAWFTLLLVRNAQAPFVGVVMFLSILLSSVIGLFASVYWSLGTASNFTHPLTRIDAIYFAVGTLSTAGTGTLSATSQVARVTQTIQMVLGMLVLLVVVGASVARFMTPSDTVDMARFGEESSGKQSAS